MTGTLSSDTIEDYSKRFIHGTRRQRADPKTPLNLKELFASEQAQNAVLVEATCLYMWCTDLDTRQGARDIVERGRLQTSTSSGSLDRRRNGRVPETGNREGQRVDSPPCH